MFSRWVEVKRGHPGFFVAGETPGLAVLRVPGANLPASRRFLVQSRQTAMGGKRDRLRALRDRSGPNGDGPPALGVPAPQRAIKTKRQDMSAVGGKRDSLHVVR